ncbi:hypothetical protein [Nocardia yunnanensis]|uniref:hypothetical protein n=1 Tax=Nocardia yunnanensis TaxID=2382165 RepID=UPI003CCC5F03
MIASVDTYLRFAEAVNRPDISAQDQKPGLPDVVKDVASGGKASTAEEAIEGVTKQLSGARNEGGGDAKQLIEAAGQQILGALGQGKSDEEEKAEAKPKTTRRRSQS